MSILMFLMSVAATGPAAALSSQRHYVGMPISMLCSAMYFLEEVAMTGVDGAKIRALFLLRDVNREQPNQME